MNIIHLIVVCVVVGVALWAINRWVPMQAGVKKAMNVAVVVLLVLWIAVSILGGLGGISDVGTVRLD